MSKNKISSDYLALNEGSVDEVFKNNMKLKNSSSSGPISDVPNAFLKLLETPVVKILTVIINCSDVLRTMKVRKHTPVHKGSEFIVSNLDLLLRPITACSSL